MSSESKSMLKNENYFPEPDMTVSILADEKRKE